MQCDKATEAQMYLKRYDATFFDPDSVAQSKTFT